MALIVKSNIRKWGSFRKMGFFRKETTIVERGRAKRTYNGRKEK